jgi:hypothetical protein
VVVSLRQFFTRPTVPHFVCISEQIFYPNWRLILAEKRPHGTKGQQLLGLTRICG